MQNIQFLFNRVGMVSLFFYIVKFLFSAFVKASGYPEVQTLTK